HKYEIESYTEEIIDLTVLAALSKSATNAIDDIIKTLMRKQKEGSNAAWENIQKYGDEEKIWLLVEKYYGYTLQEKSLKSLLIFFILTYLTQQTHTGDLPETWKKYVSGRPTNVVVFMDHWMNHRDDRAVYNDLANQTAEIIRAKHYIDQWEMNQMVQMDAFPIFDEKIIQFLVGQLSGDLAHYDQYIEIISTRRRLHWYPEYSHEYEAIFQAIQLMKHMEELDQFIPEQPSSQMFQAYVDDYYLIDTAYRKFYVAY